MTHLNPELRDWARGEIRPPTCSTSEGRMEHVVAMAQVLSWARYKNGVMSWDMTDRNLALWEAHYEYAVKQYTDPFGVKTYA